MSNGTSDDKSLFSPVVLGFVVASVVAIFALSVLLSTIGSDEKTPFRATSRSPSAIGHKGFYALLEALGSSVQRSRAKELTPVGRRGVLVVAEPDRNLLDWRRDLGRAPNVLLILPKWLGAPDLLNEGWVRNVSPLDIDEPRRIVELIDKSAMVTRENKPAWAINVTRVDPVFEGQVQLINSKLLKPLIGAPGKMLLGEYITRRSQRIWVLADPDPIENHGITNSDNARFALALIDNLRGSNGRVVFDELVHGDAAPDRNPLQLPFRFPYVIVTVQILIALLLLLLATTSRFGGAETLPPPFTLGKTRLVENTASLMDRAGHQAVVLRQYIAGKLVETGRALHAPAGLDERGIAQWLDRAGTARGIDTNAMAILDRSLTSTGSRSRLIQALFADARAIHRWSKDLQNGSERRQDNS